MADKSDIKIETADEIKVEDAVGTVIKGGEIQSVPTSGTTTLTQEMAQALEQSLEEEVSLEPTTSTNTTDNKAKEPK